MFSAKQKTPANADNTRRGRLIRAVKLTDGHSKLWRNHEAAIALFFAYYNFCRVHSSIETTPAVAAGVTDHAWTAGEFLETVATHG